MTALTIWVIGWLYACGNHQTVKKELKEAKPDIEDNFWTEYAVLFFCWPHYLGS